MTETEMANLLGLLTEPVKNRVSHDHGLDLEISYLQLIFNQIAQQRQLIGTVQQDLWCEFLPCHSLN